MKRPAKKPSSKSFDQILYEKTAALTDRVREDDRRLTARVKQHQKRISKHLRGSN
jgi:hypothetical protein